MNAQCVIVRTNSEVGGTEGLSSIIVQRGTPGITYKHLDKNGHRLASNSKIIFDNAQGAGGQPAPGSRRATSTS